MAGLAGGLLMLLWLAILEGITPPVSHFGASAWHGHEMVFGYAFAVVAGFLLTAVYNWVGRPHLSGWKLGGLAALWLAGRLALLLGDVLPAGLAAAIDLAFLPVLALVLSPPLIRARKWENVGFMGLLLVAAGCNLAFHLDAMGLADLGGSTALLTAAVEILVLFVAVLTGRVMVMFTENGIRGLKTRSFKWVERLVLPGTALFVLVDLMPFGATRLAAGGLAFAACLIHAIRLSGWRSQKTFGVPLVWVLHLGYAGLVLALFLKGLANLGWVPPSAALHAFTVAALGPVTLGMMARIGLGHTGRLIKVPPSQALAFGLVVAAGVLRVAAPLAPPFYDWLILGAGLCWMVAFTLFVFRYLPILTAPRVDGQAG